MHSRTTSLSEFVHFLFRAQLIDHNALQLEKEHPELNGQTGMQLKTFRESSTPVDLDLDLDAYDDFEDEDQFLGASAFSDMSGSFVLGNSSRPQPQPQPQRAHSGGRGHTRRASSRFDTSRFSTCSDRTSFVSSPTSTTPSSPTMASVSGSSSSGHGHGWRLYGAAATTGAQSRPSTESTRTTSTS